MVNPGEFVGGAGLGTAMSLLCAVIIDLIRKNHMFSPLLKEIQSTLESLEPLVTQMSQSNQQLPYAKPDELQGLEAVLTVGTVLVVKCGTLNSNRNPWNYIRRYKYTYKLIGWKENLEKQSKVVLMQGLRDGKETAVGVQKIEAATTKIEVSTANTEVSVEIIKSSVGNVMEELKKIKPAVFEAWSAVPQPPRHPVGLEARLKDLKEKVFQDGESMFVVTAFGGCGKTALVSQFCRDEDVKDKFNNNIFFVIISENPKMELIVKQLYEQHGRKAPDFPSKQSAEMLLDTFLQEVGKNPLLMVLDDVWPGSESLIAKFDLRMSNYKVLVTSRSQLQGFGNNYDVQLLDDEHAMELFLHSASLKAADISSALKDLATQMIERCKGNPLAIKVVGDSLRGKSEAIWKRIVKKWSKGSSIFDHTTLLLSCLQSSIDELDQETRKCFLDLGSFPQKKYISVATLFDMWTELYDIDDDIIDECIANLSELSTRGLANLVHTTGEVNMEVDGYYSQHFVIQPDLLRELAIHLSKEDKEERLLIEICGDKLPKRWSEPECLTVLPVQGLLSISTDRNFSMKWPNIQLPKAKVLVLNFQTQESQDYVLPEFLGQMPELKVLVVTCDGLFILGAALRSFQLLNKLSNLKTIILEGVSIPSITNNPVQLSCVRKISLFRCNKVSEAFSNGSVKISDAFPNLEEMNIDYCDLEQLPSHFSDLTHLKQLNITNCCGLSALPEGMEKFVNLEVLRLRFCRELSKLPDSIGLNNLTTLDLSYCTSLQKLPEYIGEMSSLKKLDVRDCGYLKELPLSISNLQQLEVVKYSHKTKKLWDALSRSPSMQKVQMVGMKLDWSDFLD